MWRTTSVIASGPSGVSKHERISARSAPALNTRWSLRMCSTETPSSAIARSTAASSCAINSSLSALTGARDIVTVSTRPWRVMRSRGAAIWGVVKGVTIAVIASSQAAGRISSESLRRSSLPVAVRGSASTACSHFGRW